MSENNDNKVEKFYKGSQLRCLLLTNGDDELVAIRLTKLISPIGEVTSDDIWLPNGFKCPKEAEIGKTTGLLPEIYNKEILKWWLEVTPDNIRVPNWDIASTCKINGQKGLLLVEAKAHSTELKPKGKPLEEKSNKDNHRKIGKAINEANIALNKIHTGWVLSRDSHYQLSNRFAWAWKIASFGVPVVLIYLGFLNAFDMKKDDKHLFKTHDEWVRVMIKYSKEIVPETIWEKPLDINGTPLYALIRSVDIESNFNKSAKD